MTLNFGELGWQGLNDAGNSLDAPLEEVVVRAATHYLDQLRSDPGRQALRTPRRDKGPQYKSIEATLEPDLADAMEAASSRDGVELEELLHHAVFLLVADIAVGRIS